MFVVVVYTAVSLASWDSLPLDSGGCDLKEETHTSIMDRIYGPISQWGAYTPTKTKVVKVIIDPAYEPAEITTNTCKGRYFMAAILEELKKYSPKVIAIDKTYGASSCTEQGPNQALTAAFRDVSLFGNVRVVIGQATQPRNAALPDDSDCLVKTRAFDFTEKAHLPAMRQVWSGLTRLNRNTLKIPLSWSTFSSNKAVDSLTDSEAPPLEPEPTFSYLAADKTDLPDDAETSRLRQMFKDYEHPYARFPRRPPGTIRAVDLLCPQQQDLLKKHGIQIDCTGAGAARSSASTSLAGHTVVIGERVESDKRFLADRETYGVDLQADYIESLLDGGYVQQSDRWDYGLLGLFVLGTAVIAVLERFKYLSSWKALLSSVSLFLALAAISLWLFEENDEFTPKFFLAFSGIILILLTQFLLLLLHTQIEQTANHRSEGIEP